MARGSTPAEAPLESQQPPDSGAGERGTVVESGEPTRDQVEEMDAGVLLFVLVLIVLMMIPMAFLFFRPRGGGSAGARSGRGAAGGVDPWQESARRADTDAILDDDSPANSG